MIDTVRMAGENEIIVNTASCQPAVCVETVGFNENPPNDVRVSSGTTCFQCVSSNGGVIADAAFTIDNETAGSIDGVMVVGGTSVITNSENIFNVLSPTQIKCEAPRICHEILVLYDCKHLSYMSAITLTSYLLSVVPVITGETTVNKGDTLELYCNVSQSNPPASSVQWLSPGGEVVSDGEPLEIASISTRRGGLYTCVTSYNNSTVTVNNSVDVTVLCKSLCSCAMISDSCAYFCLVPGFFPHTHTHTHTHNVVCNYCSRRGLFCTEFVEPRLLRILQTILLTAPRAANSSALARMMAELGVCLWRLLLLLGICGVCGKPRMVSLLHTKSGLLVFH